MGQQTSGYNACCSGKYQKNDYQETPRGVRPDLRFREGKENTRFDDPVTKHEDLFNIKEEDNPQGAEGASQQYTQEWQGAYLMFSEKDHGSMYLKWSTEQLEGALAFFQPDPEKVSPSSFKYNNGGQKEILKSKVSTTGIGRQDYYKTWVQFIRECWKFKGVLNVLEAEEAPELKVKLVMLVEQTHKVICVSVKQPVSLEGIGAVVVAQSGTTIFEGMSTMAKNLFVETGHVYGAATALTSTPSPARSPARSPAQPLLNPDRASSKENKAPSGPPPSL
eukprot:gnl/MRDRNA2_/MRDRNA2_133793_c0_seq1.p1 gnl/MRDRNA2_/MRDRNA2_133793_c0~~gnl/MRDRNA2_/MRDRNA2_133793_c0_seq1.p1  ORF type:complete len:278 (+),score=64.69 gnl/MRDRNA2_/MRDRNA2_133793_c0_seq1:93-926(+)